MKRLRFFKVLGVFVLFLLVNCSSDSGDDDSFEELSGEKVRLTIHIIPEGSGAVMPGSGSYTKGLEMTLRALANDGYFFSYWEGSVAGSNNTHNITMHSNMTVTAVFAKTNNDFGGPQQ
ncbi:InlB B-repeat-containing protein [Robiginitalea sp. IMCC43444]|uniref:InlB B-repeat-containing protein n=1 Tax=Robiginitalea sp. IMCC43444 TaxID=3459121 RepID=UPI0040417374